MSIFTTRPEIIGTFGVAASTHWLAAQTAMGVLERGGNAFDAAVAGGFVLQVVEPHLNGPGEKSPFFYGTNRIGRPRRSADKAWRLRAPAQQRSSGWGWSRGPGSVCCRPPSLAPSAPG